MFAGFGFDWPPFIRAIFNALSLLNFNFELLAPECSVTVNFETKWCACVVLVCVCSGLFSWWTWCVHVKMLKRMPLVARVACELCIPSSYILCSVRTEVR
jgi:hypothetical protein